MKKKVLIIVTVGCILLGISCIAAVNSVVSVLTIIGGDMSQKDTAVNMEGLPPFITLEMVEALLEMQETYGHPASSGLAQIICESGFGSYGPGGEEGHGLSGLAYDCKNLFGIKYWSGDQFASGNHSYTTGEQNPDGSWNTQSASFSVYKNYSDCIKQRAWMLERDPYVSHITPYKNSGNGRYTIEQANNFVSGICAGGWATSLSYEEHCKSLMETYNLYRFDNMTLESFHAAQENGGEFVGGEEYSRATQAQKDIVQSCYNTPFVGDGLCATWVSRVFNNAGQSYPYGNANSFNMTYTTGKLKVGMAICVEHSGASSESWTYGHIGIYIGDNKVMHNESSRTGNTSNGCTITDLDAWKEQYEYQCTARYGWVNGIDLTK